EKMVPADKLIYALRDVSGTVPSIPLITASILSKKLAESLDALILDVKFGCAAFMQTKEQARELAQSMVTLGKECGVNMRALLTNMDVPLGRSAGNWLEVKESVACLEGKDSDMSLLVLNCAAHLLVQTKRAPDIAHARKQAMTCLHSGAPRKKFEEMLAAQGADMNAFHRKLAAENTATYVREWKATETVFVETCDARIVGEIVRDLGGGRLTKESKINHEVGIDRLAKPGEMIQTGSIFARVHAASEQEADVALSRLRTAFTFCDEPPWLPVIDHDVVE
ncbi:MAG: deoA, partial [Verrucomicrobiales bacterium]|nr:deoA [Verrucomicrobiales bacterium]